MSRSRLITMPSIDDIDSSNPKLGALLYDSVTPKIRVNVNTKYMNMTI